MATIQFNLRVPEELKSKIDEASQNSGRSINAEATYRLEQSFEQNSNETGQLALFMAALSYEMTSQGMEFKEFQKLLIDTINTMQDEEFKKTRFIKSEKKPTA